MDAYYLLLGRPRQYDRKAIHNSFNNTYDFVKDEVRVLLGLLAPWLYHNLGSIDFDDNKPSIIFEKDYLILKVCFFD